jgi:hypothetical protein
MLCGSECHSQVVPFGQQRVPVSRYSTNNPNALKTKLLRGQQKHIANHTTHTPPQTNNKHHYRHTMLGNLFGKKKPAAPAGMGGGSGGGGRPSDPQATIVTLRESIANQEKRCVDDLLAGSLSLGGEIDFYIAIENGGGGMRSVMVLNNKGRSPKKFWC